MFFTFSPFFLFFNPRSGFPIIQFQIRTIRFKNLHSGLRIQCVHSDIHIWYIFNIFVYACDQFYNFSLILSLLLFTYDGV